MTKITPDSTRDDLARSVASTVSREQVRTSDSRQSRLHKNVRRQARNWNTTLDIDPDHSSAHVEADLNEDGEPAPNVVVTGGAIDQPVTDYSGRAWDWLVQRSMGVHEVGHIRYSDIEDKDERLSGFSSGEKGVAQNLWNAAEDGAIERQITQRWSNYYTALRALRANLFDDIEFGFASPDGTVFPLAHAAQASILDLWMREVYDLDVGAVTGLLDPDSDLNFAKENDRDLFENEVLPRCERVVEVALTEPNATSRNAGMFHHIEQIIDLLDEADADGKAQANGDGESDDDGNGMPDDARQNHSGAAESDAEEIEAPADASPSETDGTPQQPAESLADPGDLDLDGDLEARAVEESADDQRAEAGLNDDLLDELEEMSGTLGGDNLKTREIQYVDPTGEPDSTRLNEARQHSGRLAQILRNRLQSEERTETRRGQRRGRLDSTALHRTSLGERDVKKRKVEPEDKDYRCVVVLDRSGSMGGGPVQAAEVATGMLTMALEEVGVDTMLLDLHSSEVRLSKPFGTSTEHQARPLRSSPGRRLAARPSHGFSTSPGNA